MSEDDWCEGRDDCGCDSCDESTLSEKETDLDPVSVAVAFPFMLPGLIWLVACVFLLMVCVFLMIPGIILMIPGAAIAGAIDILFFKSDIGDGL